MKVSINLNEEATKKMQAVLQENGITKTEFIHQAILGIPIIALGNRKSVAQSFFNIYKALEQKEYSYELREEVSELCRFLNLLMAKIEDLRN